jgi:hypothetical protein
MNDDPPAPACPARASVERPQFWNLLSPDDQRAYEALQPTLAVLAGKSRQTKNNESFCQILARLRDFVVRGDSGDAIRGLVCGIVWLENGIAVNTHQFRLVSTKCKSSINAAFQALGYGTIPSGADVAASLIGLFPFMQRQFALVRQWTVRQKVDAAQPLRLCQIVQEKCQARQQPAPDDDITPPPAGAPDRWVDSYLNDECSLGEMVRALIRERAKPGREDPKRESPETPGVESDPFAFFGREGDVFDGFGGFDF